MFIQMFLYSLPISFHSPCRVGDCTLCCPMYLCVFDSKEELFIFILPAVWTRRVARQKASLWNYVVACSFSDWKFNLIMNEFNSLFTFRIENIVLCYGQPNWINILVYVAVLTQEYILYFIHKFVEPFIFSLFCWYIDTYVCICVCVCVLTLTHYSFVFRFNTSWTTWIFLLFSPLKPKFI